jgi:hypothetical protein
MKKYYIESRRIGISYMQLKRRKVNCVGHILCRNCLLKHVFKGKIDRRIEVMGRRGGRRKQLLEYLREATGYWKLKVEALDRTLWRIRLERAVQ